MMRPAYGLAALLAAAGLAVGGVAAPALADGGTPTSPTTTTTSPTAAPQVVSVLGVIASVDTTADTMTVTTREATTPVTVDFTSSTPIVVGDTVGTFSTSLVGDRVHVVGTEASGVISALWVHAAPAAPSEDSGRAEVEGIITTVDATSDSVTVTTEDGGPATVDVSHATITMGHRSLQVMDLVAGMRVHALGTRDTATGDVVARWMHVAAAHAHHFELEGVIAAVDPTADTMTVTTEHGGSVDVAIGDAAIVSGHHQGGSASDLTTGERVHVVGVLNPLAKPTHVALWIHAAPARRGDQHQD